MQNIKKYFMTLALLLTAVTGAWAQSSLNLVELEVPADWETDNSYVTAADLPGFNASTLDKARAWTGAPAEGVAMLIYAFDDNIICIVQFFDGEPDSGTFTTIPKNQVFLMKLYAGAKFYYPAGPTEWELKPDETGKSWTLDKMPASDVELQVEYYPESNLFLSKEALADKANIAVTAGETTVEFDDDGKSTTTVTEGTAMTVKFTGKKVLGMEVKKIGGIVLLSAATKDDIGKVVCAAGHLHDAKTAVPDGCTAVGILGKVTETGHGLILALKNATNQNWNTINGWTSVTTYAGTTLKVLPDAVRGNNLTSYTTLGETAVSNWAVAQKSDYDAIFTNLGTTAGDQDGMTYDGNVNAYITTGVGGNAMSSTYWSATEREDKAWNFDSNSWNYPNKTKSYSVRPVLGF